MSGLARKTGSHTANALADYISIMKAYGCTVPNAYADSDLAFFTLNGFFAGTIIDRGSAGAHNDKADAAVRLIKEIVRSIQAHVQRFWKIPAILVEGLVKNACYQLNTFRGRNYESSPRIEVTGIKPNAMRDLALAFGDYCEVRDPAVVKNNEFADRTQGFIALYPSGNSH